MLVARTVAALLLAAAIPAAALAADDRPPTLTVYGAAVLSKPADQFTATIGIVTRDDAVTTALTDNSKQMNAMIEALAAAGLGDDGYETGRFSIRPVYSPRPRDPRPDWQPTIVGYEVTNTLSIETTQLDLAGPLIEAAARAGANSIDGIGFGIDDPRKHREEAIATATKHAMDDARMLADAASLRLVRILDISLDHARPTPMPMNGFRMAQAEMAPPMIPGDVNIQAGVTITYLIEQREGQE